MNTAYVELESATVRAALYTFLEYSVVQHGSGDDKHLEPFKPDMKGRLHAFRSQASSSKNPQSRLTDGISRTTARAESHRSGC
jgi:hypothetical protein